MSGSTTTIVPFTPRTNASFQFQATLDGNVYQIVASWNLFSQRWYLDFLTLQSEIVFSLPLIGSPDNYAISHTAGYFTTTLVFRVSTSQFEITG